MSALHYDGPVLLVVLDGVGLRTATSGNAVARARTDFLDSALMHYPHLALQASGEAVGILPGTMGNSEVGHNAIGSGQIIQQGIAKVENAFKSGEIWETKTWRDLIQNVKDHHSTLHLAGIFSDGKVHSDIHHLFKLIEKATAEGLTRIRVHAVLDGRDTPPQSANLYISQFDDFVKTLPSTVDCRIASGGGRMVYFADRYENDWGVVQAGWDAAVRGQAQHYFTSAAEAIREFRRQDADLQDQYLPPFVVVEASNSSKPKSTQSDPQPIGRVQDGDSFIYFDFRADRAVEVAQAFTYHDFPHFDRGTRRNRRPDVYFAGLTEYNSDLHVPEHQLVAPVQIKNPLNQFLGRRGLSQFAIAETLKFGHITYYFNGNSHKKAPREKHLEIPSDTRPLDQRPWMKSAEITDALLDQLANYRFARVNFAGGDMVGHLGAMQPTIVAMEAIDLQLRRLAQKIDELGGIMIITADHGNAEQLLDAHGHAQTSHTTNPVPCIFYDNTQNARHYRLAHLKTPGLANLAATIATLLGQSDLPSSWESSLIVL